MGQKGTLRGNKKELFELNEMQIYQYLWNIAGKDREGNLQH